MEDFDYCFAENGLTAYRMGEQLASQVRNHTKYIEKELTNIKIEFH